jgi:ketosteroid isomerase-like protein
MRSTTETTASILLVVLLCAVTFTSATAKDKKGANANAAPDLAKMREDWKNYYNNKQADQLAALYTDDATFATVSGVANGRDQIKALLQREVDAGNHLDAIDSQKSETAGDTAYDRGTFSGTVNGQSVSGNYLVMLKKVGGKWLIAAHNSVIPQKTSQ